MSLEVMSFDAEPDREVTLALGKSGSTFSAVGFHRNGEGRAGQMNLTNRETEALDALADTFVPSLGFAKDEDPVLFSMSASDLGVSTGVAEALDQIDPAKAQAFRFFLGLLENPLFIASVSSSASRFSRLPHATRE